MINTGGKQLGKVTTSLVSVDVSLKEKKLNSPPGLYTKLFPLQKIQESKVILTLLVAETGK